MSRNGRMNLFVILTNLILCQIFVHCLAGSSRAPTAVLAYLITEKRIPLVDAYNYITSLRSFVRPNNRFLFQLAMLEVIMISSNLRKYLCLTCHRCS